VRQVLFKRLAPLLLGCCASTRQERRSGPIRGGQGRPVDRSRRLGLARPAGDIREVERGLTAVPALGAERRLRTNVQGLVWRPRFRIRPDRWNHHPRPPARDGRKMGTQNQAIGRSRGGLTTKTVALVDALGNLARLVLAQRPCEILPTPKNSNLSQMMRCNS
jgi:hypothetical protein